MTCPKKVLCPMFIGIPSIEFKFKHPNDWLIFFFFKSSPPDDCQVKVPSDGSQVCRGNRTGEVLSWDHFGILWWAHLVCSFWHIFDGSIGGPIWGSLFGILWCDPLVSPLYGTDACCLSFVVGLLADLDYLGADRLSLLFGGIQVPKCF